MTVTQAMAYVFRQCQKYIECEVCKSFKCSFSPIFVGSHEIVILIVIKLFANNATLKLHDILQIIFRLQGVVKS